MKKICLCLYYKRESGYIFNDGVEVYKINTKGSKINAAALCLRNNSKCFPADIKKIFGLSGYVYLIILMLIIF